MNQPADKDLARGGSKDNRMFDGVRPKTKQGRGHSKRVGQRLGKRRRTVVGDRGW